MNSNPIALWLKQSPSHRGQDAHVGRLIFSRLRADTAPPKGIKIVLEPIVHQPFLAAHENPHWVALSAEVTSQKTEPRTYGRVLIDPHSQMPGFGVPANEIEWNWRLLPEDFERIERDRSDAKGSPLNVNVLVTGIIEASTGTHMVWGSGNLEIALSDWELYLRMLRYNLPHYAAELAGLAAVDHPTWKEASERLSTARMLLRAGEGRAAMTTCLQQFERIVTAPYNESAWRERYAVPDQKEDGLVAMLAGHCKYLNKVGYHRSRRERDAAGGLVEMPVDQWEAELAVGASQFWLAYSMRLPKNPVEVKYGSTD